MRKTALLLFGVLLMAMLSSCNNTPPVEDKTVEIIDTITTPVIDTTKNVSTDTAVVVKEKVKKKK